MLGYPKSNPEPNPNQVTFSLYLRCGTLLRRCVT